MENSKYTVDSALRKVLRNGDTKQTMQYYFLVRNGSVGNGTLGAISFLNKRSNYTFKVTQKF